jgi:hypothetical protein
MAAREQLSSFRVEVFEKLERSSPLAVLLSASRWFAPKTTTDEDVASKLFN